MGGKKKAHNNHKQQSNTKVHEVGSPSEEVLQQLIEISEPLKHYKKRLRQTQYQHGYLLSTRWLGNWKSYTGYDALSKEQNPEDMKGFGKKKPTSRINDDLLAKPDAKFVKIPQTLDEYAYLNYPVDEDYGNQKEFIIIDQGLWSSFVSRYSDAISIRRPLRKSKSGQPYVDVSLHYFNFVILTPQIVQKFTSMTEGQYDKIMKRNKKDETLQKILPVKKLRIPSIWNLETLEKFLKQFVSKYTQSNNGNKLQLWRMQNYLSFAQLRQNLLSFVRGVQIGILGNKLNNYHNDIEDFIKNTSVILISCGDLQLVRLPPPRTPDGYCEECVEDKQLVHTCLCEEVFYCSLKCLHDDKAYHFMTCDSAYDSQDDIEYKKKSVFVETKEVRCGLNNLGNTCYMNSSLQCLINLEWLFQYYSSNKYLKLIPKQQLEENKGIFVNKFSKFLKKMNESQVYSPYSLKSQISHYIAPFKGYNQHDANDFIIYFLNTLNDFIIKEGDQAFGDIILKNLTGKFKSSVTCPECKLTSVTEDIYLQVSLPIKTKIAEKQIQYIIVKKWNEYEKGMTLVTSWDEIAGEIKEKKDCRKFIGNQGGDFKEIEEESVEQIHKKHKKQTLVYYPALKSAGNYVEIRMNLAYSKVIAGNQMKTVYGFPIFEQLNPNMKLWELYLLVAKMVSTNEEGLKQLEQLKNNIEKQIEQTKTKFYEQKQNKLKQAQIQTKDEEKVEEVDFETQEKLRKQKQQQELQQLESSLSKVQQKWNQQLTSLRDKLKFRLSVVTGRKGKKLCQYCNKKCSMCILPFSTITSLEQFQKLGQSNLEIDIYLDEKLEIRQKYFKSTRNQYTTLAECLEQFSQPQLLDEQNAWYCQACDMMRLAEKELRICQYPKTMIIQLKRFKQHNGKKVKNNQTVWYPEILQIEDKGLKYQLSGVVVHEGSLDAGHYWAVCRKGKEYYVFNDSEVKRVSDYFQKGAYILVYEIVEDNEI